MDSHDRDNVDKPPRRKPGRDAGQRGDATLRTSRHASARKQQRAVSSGHIALVLQWGRQIRQRGGRTAWFVGSKEVKAAAKFGVRLDPVENLAVVLADDGAIVTVVRSSDVARLRRWRRA